MSDQEVIKLFELERNETDVSLVAKRNKVTSSVDRANTKLQKRTDEIVETERSSADQMTAASRADHDESLKCHSVSSSESPDQSELRAERRRTDLATGIERKRMDKAISAERSLASTYVAKFLELERKATDHNLLAERTATDQNYNGSSERFDKEQAEHEKTKLSLTSREEYLAIVSRDLRNPISAICAYAELILQGEGDSELGPETRNFIEVIKRNADISLRLIADLLDVERITQKKLEMTFTVNSATEIAQTVIDIFAPRAKELGTKLTFKLMSPDAEIECDHDRILQVASNLVGNALKYIGKHGVVEMSVTKNAERIQFAVKDNGPGIPLEKQAEIFNRFAQLASKDRTGLGLGLYISKKFGRSS